MKRRLPSLRALTWAARVVARVPVQVIESGSWLEEVQCAQMEALYWSAGTLGLSNGLGTCSADGPLYLDPLAPPPAQVF